MKLKDLDVNEMLVVKYLACKFLIEAFKPDSIVDDIISELAKNRLADKHNIQDADNKNIDDVVFEITKDNTKEEKAELVSVTYDYIVNKLFSIENSDQEDPDNYFPDSLVIRPTNGIIQDRMLNRFNTLTMQVMYEDYFKQIKDANDLSIKNTMLGSANDTNKDYALIIM